MSRTALVVGLGQIGMGYDLGLDPSAHVHSHARAFDLHLEFELAGGVDSDPARREAFTATYHRPAFADLAEGLTAVSPDVVVIAVPTHLHAPVLRTVLAKSKPQAILCEKPLSFDLDEAREMVRTCAEAGVGLWVNYMRRSDQACVEIKQRINTGAIETPLKGFVWYSKGFKHNGGHFVDLLRVWLGAIKSAKVIDPGSARRDGDAEPDVQIVFERGTVIFAAGRNDSMSHHCVELLSPTGRLRYDFGGRQVEWSPATSSAGIGAAVLSRQPEMIPSGMDRYQVHVTEQLARALDGRDAHLCSGTEALETLKAVHFILNQP